jgi:hypothetical protein
MKKFSLLLALSLLCAPFVKGQEINDNEIMDNAMFLYPNPAHDFVNIQFSSHLDEQPQEITIYNLNGKKVYSISETEFKNPTIKVDLSSLQAGTYLIWTEFSDIVSYKKFVKL